jgi:hypothetical protein
MLGALLDQLDPSAAAEFRARARALHQAVMRGNDATVSAATAVKAVTEPLVARLATTTMDAGDMRKLMSALIARSSQGEYGDYAAAEQVTMALASIADAMKTSGALSNDQFRAVNRALDRCYEAVEKDEEYDQRRFVTAIQGVSAALGRS